LKIPINIPDIDKEEIREVTAVLSEKSLTSSSFEGGKRVQQFEKLLSKFVKSKFAVAVNSELRLCRHLYTQLMSSLETKY